MLKFLKSAAISGFLLAASGSQAGFITYSVTDLGPIGGEFTQKMAINSAGHVILTRYVPNVGHRSFIYDGVSFTDIGTLGLSTDAWEINDAGQVVGYSTFSDGNSRGFLYSNGSMTSLDVFRGPFHAYSINNSGEIVGVYNSYQRAFAYKDGVARDLGTLGGVAASAVSINDVGQVAGSSGFPNTNFLIRAVLFDNGSVINLGTLGGEYSSATAINNLGQVVGFSKISMSEPNTLHGFIYSEGSMISMGSLGGTTTVPNAINDKGIAVGWSLTLNNARQGAFIYREGSMKNLALLVDPTLGWNLLEAFDINNNNQIVGQGLLHGQKHAFLMTPLDTPLPGGLPEPSSWAMLIGGFGLTGAAMRKRRMANASLSTIH